MLLFSKLNKEFLLYVTKPRMWKRLFRQSLSLPITKNEKTIVDNFFYILWVCSLPSPTLYHFEETKTYPCITITLPTSLKLIVPNYFVFFFLDIRTRVECRTVLFNLFVIAEPLMYLCVCHGTPTNKTLEITNCL